MRVRAIDGTHDWLFGKGQNDYLQGRKACVQNINTRLYEFLGDCFFNNAAGINWFELLGSKDQVTLNLAVSAVILNTQDVTGINEINAALSSARDFRIEYEVATSYGTAADTFIFDPNNI
jgi:hypothetical protein